MSFMVNPLSAILDTSGLSLSVTRKPDFLVSSTSDINPTNTGEM